MTTSKIPTLRLRENLARVALLMVAVAAASLFAPAATAAVPLPGGRPNYVVSVMGGSLNAYHSRIAQYTFTAGSGAFGTVREEFWYWNMATFTGGAAQNKVYTGYNTTGTGCGNCKIRTPVRFQSGSAGKTLTGTYYIDVYGRLVISWNGGQIEAWSITRYPTYARLTLHHSNMGLIRGDGFGSTASFFTGANRDAIKNLVLIESGKSASYCNSGNCPTANNGYPENVNAPVNFGRDYIACSSSPCLSLYNNAWRSKLVIDPNSNGRRVFWQHQNYGVDHYYGPCFSDGGGHTWALLQAIDDNGGFLGMVGAEASLANRTDANAVISQISLTRQ